MASNAAPSVPLVDISPFTTGGDLESCKRAAKDLLEKGRINGSIGITGHGLLPDVLKESFEVAKKLFDLPYEEKMKAPHPDSTVPHRGYSGIAREKGAAKTALETDDQAERDEYMNTSDYKESYEIGSEDNSVQYNIWLPEDVFPGFRHFTTKLFHDLNKVASAIMEALIMSLDLREEEANSVRALHNGFENQLRLLHYPPIPTEMLKNKEIGRLGAHTDWSSFTLVFQDTNSGLEFIDSKTGQFMPATPLDGVVYMNIADMFQRISNGIYPSAHHRVVISGKANGESTPARFSIPFFVSPLADGIIEPQPSLVAARGEKLFEPVTFNSYAEKMFQTTQTQLSDSKE